MRQVPYVNFAAQYAQERAEITAREHQILLECALKRDAATAIAQGQ